LICNSISWLFIYFGFLRCFGYSLEKNTVDLVYYSSFIFSTKINKQYKVWLWRSAWWNNILCSRGKILQFFIKYQFLGVKPGERFRPINIIKECFGDWRLCLNVICSEMTRVFWMIELVCWSRFKPNFWFHCALRRWSLVCLWRQETLEFFRIF
jgi:hypothetical protein